ncbi:hypothetical protein [Kitasatospora indigofera]
MTEVLTWAIERRAVPTGAGRSAVRLGREIGSNRSSVSPALGRQ